MASAPLLVRLPHRVTLALLAMVLAGAAARAADGPAVRITSPQGRLAGSGAIRIVAVATPSAGRRVQKVAFFVGEAAIGEDAEGPVYAAEWLDENPFEVTRVRAVATDDAGVTAEAVTTLPALEIADETSIASVLLDVAVVDARGRYVSGLTHEHFAVDEDGVRQDLELVEPSRMPTVVTMLVDTSQSMSTRFAFVKRAMRRLSTLLRPGDRIAVVPFSRTVGAMTGPTDDMEALTSAIDGLDTRGGTAIADALASISARLSGAEGRQVIVLITDGYDEHSAANIEDAVAAVKRANATLYAVGIGGVAGMSFRGREVLTQVSAQTGGRAFFPASEAQLPLVQEHLHDDVVSRYLVTYTPSNQERDGTWRRIRVRTGNADFVVRTREGYFAPAPVPIRPSIEFTITSTTPEAVAVGAEDLLAIEDGVPQKVDTFHEAAAPVSVLLALDESGSMKKAAEDVKAAALTFVDAVRDEDRLGIVTFSEGARLVTDLTLSRAVPRNGIAAYRTWGGTALNDAVLLALDRLATEEGRRAVVVLTDGRDENNPGTGPGSRASLEQVIARLRDVDAAVFAIGLGPNVDRVTLQRLADASGGQAYFPATVAELPARYAQVVEDLRRRYVLSYESTNGARDGAWRSVVIRPRRPGIAIASRGGYRAPAR